MKELPVLPFRSCLFVPGHRPERFDKACASGADAVIIDLEDAVAFSDKALARQAAREWLKPSCPVLLRINGMQSEWFADDMQLVHLPGIAGIVLPKTEYREDIEAVRSHTTNLPIFPMIETALGFDHVQQIAAAQGVQRLLFGSLDFQLDLGISADDDALLYFRSHLVLASRLANIQAPVDGVCQAIDDDDIIKSETLHAKRLGFGGKLCIHPRQIPYVNQCFHPTSDELAWAEKVVAAAASVQGAAVAVDGKMVDRPVILRAEEMVRVARQRSASL